MDTDFIFQTGYIGLFIISFLAASLVPLTSEIFVLGMIPLGYPRWGIILVATVGNYLGALVNYYVGKKGSEFILSRYIKIDPKTWQRAEDIYQRWGPIALMLSWMPIVGDPLTAVAGALNMRLTTFTFWVVLGKWLRYLALLGIFNQIMTLF